MVRLFDSASEKRVFEDLEAKWARHGVRVVPQMRIERLIGHDELAQLRSFKRISNSEYSYLRLAEVDFAAYDRAGDLLLAIEFDGLGRGLSQQGRYIAKVPTDDPLRPWKFKAKLKALPLSLVVISYDEASGNGASRVEVVDALIAQVIESQATQEAIDAATCKLQHDAELDDLQTLVFAAECVGESRNPIRRRIRRIKDRIGFGSWDDFTWTRSHERSGWVGGTKQITGGIKGTKTRVLFAETAYVRDSGPGASTLAELLAEWLLWKRAWDTLGDDRIAWQELIDKTPWEDPNVFHR